MPLFQNSVLNKYLKGVDSAKAEKAWSRFKSYFHVVSTRVMTLNFVFSCRFRYQLNAINN